MGASSSSWLLTGVVVIAGVTLCVLLAVLLEPPASVIALTTVAVVGALIAIAAGRQRPSEL